MSKTTTTTLVKKKDREKKTKTYIFIEIEIGEEWTYGNGIFQHCVAHSVCRVLIQGARRWIVTTAITNKQTQRKKKEKKKKKIYVANVERRMLRFVVRSCPRIECSPVSQSHGRELWTEGDKQENSITHLADLLKANATTTDVVN